MDTPGQASHGASLHGAVWSHGLSSMTSCPTPPESSSPSWCILCWFTESAAAEAEEESLLSPAESLPRGAASAAAAPALSAAVLLAAGRCGGTQLRPGQQLRPLLRTHASLQRSPAYLAHWATQVTFRSPSEAGCWGKLDGS